MFMEKTAGMIIFYKDSDGKARYLLLKYNIHKQKHWDFVKGMIEPGETTKEAALRETFEETGIEQEMVRIIEEFVETIIYYYRRSDKGLTKKEVTYLLGVISERDAKKIKISEEHEEYKWATKEEALEMIKFEETRRVLRTAEEYSNKK